MNQELRIKVSSYDHKTLDSTVRKLVETVKASGCDIKGPIPLPTKREIFTILRSPHVNKSSREQFERKTHKRVLVLTNPSSDTLMKLKTFVVPASVAIKVVTNKEVKGK